MRIRDLVINSVAGRVLLTAIVAATAWALASRVFTGEMVNTVDALLTTGLLGGIWGLTSHQVSAVAFFTLSLLACYLLGQWVVRPVFVRRWAIPFFFVGLAMLDLPVAIAAAFGSAILLGIGYLRVTKGIGSVLAFIPMWERLLYAALFVGMVWVMCGFTAESETYPALVWLWAELSVPQQWLFGFWVPGIAQVAVAIAAAMGSYVLGGYFFAYLVRHWIGPVSLGLFLVLLAPGRFAQLFLLYPQFVFWPMVSVGALWAIYKIRTASGCGKASESLDQKDIAAAPDSSNLNDQFGPPNGPFCLNPDDAINPDSDGYVFALLHNASR